MSVFGFVIDGVHYVGGCDTPYEPYPYCDELALPSYSTAKSLVGGLGLMLAEKRYPGIRNTLVADYVDACGTDWSDVTIQHALDLVTGHYGSTEPHEDEDTASSDFFVAEHHAGKIDFACNAFPRKSPPGTHWSYQTWATYLAGTALNSRLQSLEGNEADFYDDLIVEKLWKPLELSELMMTTRRTYDSVAQPFSGFGLTMLRDDVAKLAVFLGENDGQVDNAMPLDKGLFDAIKQRVPNDPGMQAESDLIRYNNGFRTFDVGSILGCSESAWLTTMSGYGGINVVLMPNNTAYYYFSDGNVHRYLNAVRESHRIRPIC
jgi:CubicO group peptidase (beta-lactamase class C family)